MVADEDAPLAWADRIATNDSSFVFRVRPAERIPAEPRHLRGWIVAPDLTKSLIDRWPTEAPLLAEVDSVGPGGQSAWIRAGTNQGVRVGDCWWLRIGGQPAARCDVRFVTADVSFCAVVPLASEPSVRTGIRVALWPAPGERRTGRAMSAVSFIEERNNSTVVWVAAPSGIACPSEPHLDFFHGVQYIDHGVVERRDNRFWYARLLPTTLRGDGPTTDAEPAAPDAALTSAPSSLRPSSQPARITVPLTPPLRVGDDVVVRTQADVDQRRFVARVFDLTAAGALVNAGEADGLMPGQTLTLYHAGKAAGEATIQSVQRSYAVVASSTGPDGAPVTPRIGDELRLDLPPPASTIVGIMQRIVDETIFVARMPAATPLGIPLAVQASGETVGVAVLVTAKDDSAIGFVLPCSSVKPAAAGMQLVREAESPPVEKPTSRSAEPPAATD